MPGHARTITPRSSTISLRMGLISSPPLPAGDLRIRHASGSQLCAADQEDPGLHLRRTGSTLRVLGDGWLLISKEQDSCTAIYIMAAQLSFCGKGKWVIDKETETSTDRFRRQIDLCLFDLLERRFIFKYTLFQSLKDLRPVRWTAQEVQLC